MALVQLAAELASTLAGITAANLHSTRRHVFHVITDVAAVMKLASRVGHRLCFARRCQRREARLPLVLVLSTAWCTRGCDVRLWSTALRVSVPGGRHVDAVWVVAVGVAQADVCAAQDELEKVLLRVLEAELKLVSIPVQTTLADCFTGLYEWGDSRKLTDAVTKLVSAAAKKGIDCGCRVYVASGMRLAFTFESASRPPRSRPALSSLWLCVSCIGAVATNTLLCVLRAGRRCTLWASCTRTTAGSCRSAHQLCLRPS